MQLINFDIFERHTQFPCYDTTHNKNGIIKSCKWQGQTVACSELFKAFPTDVGMCCSFNMKKAEEMFKASQYQKMVNLMQTMDKSKSLKKSNNGDWNNNPIPQEGRDKGLELILDAHRDIVSGGTVMEDFDGFFAIIDSNEQFPMVKRKSVLIRPGHNNFVALEAMKVMSNENLKDVDIDKRNCLFPNEMELYYHKNYSKANCDLEGSMIHAMSQVRIISCLSCVANNISHSPDE